VGAHETFEMPCKFRPNEPPGPAFPAPQNDATGGVYGDGGGDGGDGGGVATWRMTVWPRHVACLLLLLLLQPPQHEYGWSGTSAELHFRTPKVEKHPPHERPTLYMHSVPTVVACEHGGSPDTGSGPCPSFCPQSGSGQSSRCGFLKKVPAWCRDSQVADEYSHGDGGDGDGARGGGGVDGTGGVYGDGGKDGAMQPSQVEHSSDFHEHLVVQSFVWRSHQGSQRGPTGAFQAVHSSQVLQTPADQKHFHSQLVVCLSQYPAQPDEPVDGMGEHMSILVLVCPLGQRLVVPVQDSAWKSTSSLQQSAPPPYA